MDYAKMTKAELIREVGALLDRQRDADRDTMVALRHDLSVHQIELEMQNRELREAQAALEASRDRFVELYDFAPIAYLNFDIRGTIGSINLAGAMLLDQERARITGRSFGTFLDPEGLTAFKRHLEACQASPRSQEVELRLRIRPSEFLPVKLTTVFNDHLSLQEGKFLSTLEDLTARKKAEELAQHYARELESQVGARTTELRDMNSDMELFTMSVAHDLRAPLRRIRGFAEILLDEERPHLSEQSAKAADRIIASATQLDRMLLDLLEYSRVSRADIKLQPVKLRELIDDIIEEQTMSRRHAPIQVVVDSSLPDVSAHESVLRQVFANLFENARKFVRPGIQPLVNIRADVYGQRARIWIEDNGIGIAPEHHERIFAVFERLHGPEYEGTGIGLALAKRALTRMGGRIGVVSELGAGSRFWLELPLARK